MQITKLFKVAKLQSIIVFELNNKSIADIELILCQVIGKHFTSSIAFNRSWKQKWDKASEPSKNAIFLSKTFAKLIVVLADMLTKAQELQLAATSIFALDNSIFEIKIHEIE